MKNNKQLIKDAVQEVYEAKKKHFKEKLKRLYAFKEDIEQQLCSVGDSIKEVEKMDISDIVLPSIPKFASGGMISPRFGETISNLNCKCSVIEYDGQL